MNIVENEPNVLIGSVKPTGLLRINISTLEQQFEITEYRNGRQCSQTKEWRTVPVGDFGDQP